MLKVSTKVSLWLSLGLSVILFGLCCAGMVILPTFTELLIAAKESINPMFSWYVDYSNAFVLFLAYAILFVVTFADILLFLL